MTSIRLVAVIVACVGWCSALAINDDANQPILIDANQANYSEKTGEAVYHGNVQATQGSMQLSNADVMTIYQKNNKTDRIVATGKPVRIKQEATEGREEVRGESLKSEYYPDKSLLVLIDNATVWQGSNTYTSDRIEYDSRNSIVRAGASNSSQRVHVKLAPAAK